MSLVTPEFGLLFWMVVIFGIVFFLLAKFGFPIITDMLDERSARIAKSLKDADEIEARMATWKVEQAQLLEAARKQQSEILRKAAETREQIIAEARDRAREEADRLLKDAKTQIEAEKESALRDVRKEIALLSVEVASGSFLRSLLSMRTSVICCAPAPLIWSGEDGANAVMSLSSTMTSLPRRAMAVPCLSPMSAFAAAMRSLTTFRSKAFSGSASMALKRLSKRSIAPPFLTSFA